MGFKYVVRLPPPPKLATGKNSSNASVKDKIDYLVEPSA